MHHCCDGRMHVQYTCLFCCVWIFISICECVCLSLGVCTCKLAYFLHLWVYACVVILPACLTACAPFNWRNWLAWPSITHTPRQLECWIIWAVSGPVSLWALLYIHRKHWGMEKRICIHSRRALAASTADKGPQNTGSTVLTLHQSAI